MKITKSQLKEIILEELDSLLLEGRSAAKTVGDPPYREQGATESQAQQKAAGAAYGCRKKRGKERDECAAKLKKRGGAAWDLYSGEITFKELRNLAKLGQKVKQHKSKEPKHLKSLPGHATPKKESKASLNLNESVFVEDIEGLERTMRTLVNADMKTPAGVRAEFIAMTMLVGKMAKIFDYNKKGALYHQEEKDVEAANEAALDIIKRVLHNIIPEVDNPKELEDKLWVSILKSQALQKALKQTPEDEPESALLRRKRKKEADVERTKTDLIAAMDAAIPS